MNQKSRELYSVSKELKKEHKSNDLFEIMLSRLPLEDLIALKLEVAFKSMGTPVYGIPIFKATSRAVKEATLKYAISATDSKRQAAMLLGLNYLSFIKQLKKYNLLEYYNKNDN